MKKNINLYSLSVGLMIAAAGQAQITSPSLVIEDRIKISGITTQEQIYTLTPAERQSTRTYFDGIGRAIQTIHVKASASQKDIVTPFSYNQLNQPSYAYLGYVAGNGDGSFHTSASTEQTNYYGNGLNDKVADDSKPWSKIELESSPLQRLLAVGMKGDHFQPDVTNINQHYKSVIHRSNNVTIYPADAYNTGIRIWNENGTSTQTYASGSLTVIELKEEEGNVTNLYKDLQGRKILKRQLLSQAQVVDGQTEYCLDTYYIYDEPGKIVAIVPPKAIAGIRNAGGAWDLSATAIDKQVYRYTYDDLGNIITKKVPGAAIVYAVYDPLNRPVLVQDGNSRHNNSWLYFKYDSKGRVISQGHYKDPVNGTSQAAMQNYVKGLTGYNTHYYEERQTSGALPRFYTNRVFPTANQDGSPLQDLLYNYFDDYDLNRDGTADYLYQNQGLNNEATAISRVRGMQTIVFDRTINNDATLDVWLAKVNFYDKRGNLIQVLTSNHTNATAINDRHTIVPDFTGKPMQAKTTKTVNGTITTALVSYAYDHMERVKIIDQSNNGAATVRVAEYVYNEIGQRVNKKLHSTDNVNFLQNVDFRYNIRGLLTSINNSTLTVDNVNHTNSDANDVFGEEILYEKTESGLGNTAVYNGNISAIKWKALPPAGNTNQRRYNYSYDGLSRMTMAQYAEWNSAGNSWTNAVGHNDEKNLVYDLNGNIKQLERYASNTLIDHLTYTYDGNTLNNVADASGNASGLNGGNTMPYLYDPNGNLTSDTKKALTISYNIVDRTDKIVLGSSGNYIRYTYNANGSVLRKEVHGSSSTITYDYIDGFVYQNNVLSHFSMAEGRVRNNSGTLTFEYFISDHLGNVRVSFESNQGTLVVKQENSYYPFGMNLPGNYLPSQPNNNLFNGGSEWQNDFGNLPDFYQTYFRNYDAALGRFIGVDPLADMYESLTPYQYGLNNPMLFNDPSGALSQPSEPSCAGCMATVYVTGYTSQGTGISPWEWSLLLNSLTVGTTSGLSSYDGPSNNGNYYVGGSGWKSGDPVANIINRSMKIKAGKSYSNANLYYTGKVGVFQRDLDEIAHTTVGSIMLAMIETWGIKIHVEDVPYTPKGYTEMQTSINFEKQEISIHYASITEVPGERVVCSGAIILFHEMMHAADIISKALEVTNFVRPINKNSKLYETEESARIFGGDRNRVYREVRAVMFENLLRNELKMPRRFFYGDIDFRAYLDQFGDMRSEYK